MSDMKTITLYIQKKNRVYFKCKKGDYDVKLLIDDNSKNLELGVKDLLLKDISIHTKYGSDIIYKLAVSAEEQEKSKDKIVTLRANYNKNLVDECKKLGGRWDSSSKTWVFSAIVEEEVEKLDYIFNSELITIEITATSDCYAGQNSLKFCGIIIAYATGRDSGANLGENIYLIDGRINSGGSIKNWTTYAIEGSVFRLKIPKLVLEEYKKIELGRGNFIITKGVIE